MSANKKDRTKIACMNCKFWSFDMDLEAFCVNSHAGPMGTDIDAMRGIRPLRFAKVLCGPEAQFFEQGAHSRADQELNA